MTLLDEVVSSVSDRLGRSDHEPVIHSRVLGIVARMNLREAVLDDPDGIRVLLSIASAEASTEKAAPLYEMLRTSWANRPSKPSLRVVTPSPDREETL